MRRRASTGGFTLVELVMVLAVVALVAVIVLPRLGWIVGASDFAAAREQVVSELRIARGRAIEQRHSTVIAPAALDAGTVTLTMAPPDGIRFHADGSSSGGSVVLTSGRREAVVTVDWLTGRVRVAD
ncbi:prepilin-type N-terminal cleavage/methylation domain-containing protein [Desertibaculum subflavum]|uniref:prepilin-type N-terminal cleavage/methylation domain-containing protein n=1 Tax=Desertibaculum subflavum TaxID=2268458 RepID=UPI000E664C12